MDDLLVQKLTQQIDAQIAQAVQSQSVDAKGAYLWQNYPQVRSCATYVDGVTLLAREQAALQCSPTGFGSQSPSINPAQAGFGSPPPTNVFGSPAVPQSGNAGAQKTTAFQLKKAPVNGKVLGFIPSEVFAVIVILLIVSVIVVGTIKSITKVSNQNVLTPATEPTQSVQHSDPTEDPIDELFN